MKTTKNTTNTKPKMFSFDEVFAAANTSKTFKVEYDKELSRLRLAKQIRDARISKKLTQKAVADRIGIPQSVVARIESGVHGVSVDTLERMASAFGKKIQLV